MGSDSGTGTGKQWHVVVQTPFAAMSPLGVAMHSLVLGPTAAENAKRQVFVGFMVGCGRTREVNMFNVDLDLQQTSVPVVDLTDSTRPPVTFESPNEQPMETAPAQNVGRTVVASPNDKVLSGISIYDLMVSQDQGRTWSLLLRQQHTLSGASPPTVHQAPGPSRWLPELSPSLSSSPRPSSRSAPSAFRASSSCARELATGSVSEHRG